MLFYFRLPFWLVVATLKTNSLALASPSCHSLPRSKSSSTMNDDDCRERSSERRATRANWVELENVQKKGLNDGTISVCFFSRFSEFWLKIGSSSLIIQFRLLQSFLPSLRLSISLIDCKIQIAFLLLLIRQKLRTDLTESAAEMRNHREEWSRLKK